MTTVILALPNEVLTRIRVVDLQNFLLERGLQIRQKITPDLITLTAHVPGPNEQTMTAVRSNLVDFTERTAVMPRVPTAGYDGPDAA